VARPSWRERWVGWRNDRLVDPRFQRWAADFPLTAPIARRRAAGLFDLVAGFIYAQTLDACIRLDLFARLRQGPLSVATLSEAVDLPQERVRRLLGAAAALRLAEPLDEDRWALGDQGAALLGSTGLTQMIAHHRDLYADMADPVGLLRAGQGRLAAYWPYATSDEPQAADLEAVSGYSALMAATAPDIAADALAAYDVRRHRRLMDVGGGEGMFLIAAARAAPKLELALADLPSVVERARNRLGEAGLADRVRLTPVDVLHEPLPTGADLVSLVRILHDHDEAGVGQILRRVRKALPPDGALMIAEPMSAAPRPDRVADAYFAFYLLAMGRGRARTPAEIAVHLRAAGFTRIRRRRTRYPALLQVMIARP
jgi:demethylspheroidene O-methyltransferase